MNAIFFNGNFHSREERLAGAGSRGLRYGDGLFETILVVQGRIPLFSLHLGRLLSGMDLLGMQFPANHSAQTLKEAVLSLCNRNNCAELGRVRLTVFRGDGGPFDPPGPPVNYCIEAGSLDPARIAWNENGLVTGIYPVARKSTDPFSNLKSANYLPYLMAAAHAKREKWNEAFLLNTYSRIADACIANIFLAKNGRILTPSLAEGGVAGVMRKFLLTEMNKAGYTVHEEPLTIDDLEQADEIFLTNAISGIRWVKEFQNRNYGCRLSAELFRSFVTPLHTPLYK